MNLSSTPMSPWSLNDRARTKMRCDLVACADAFRMEGKLVKAEKLYREAIRYTDTGPGAVEHLERMAEHCRELFETKKVSRKALGRLGRNLRKAA